MTRKRDHGEGTLERLPSGKWRFVARVDGERRRKTLEGQHSETQARRLLALWVADQARTSTRAGGRITLGAALDDRLNAGDLAKTTLTDYRRALDMIPPAARMLPIDKITVEWLERFYGLLLDAGRTPDRVHRVADLLGSTLQRQVRYGRLIRNPCHDAVRPRIDRPAIEIPDDGDIITALEVLAGTWIGLYVRLAAVTGARRGEIAALRWTAVDLEARTVTISRSFAVVPGELVEKDVKTGAGGRRTLSLDVDTVEQLQSWKADQERRADRAKLPAPAMVFTRRPATDIGVRPDVAGQQLARRLKAAGVRPIGLHDLRHALASHLLNDGVSIAAVSAVLGHSSVATTLRVYSHVVEQVDAATLTSDRLRRRGMG